MKRYFIVLFFTVISISLLAQKKEIVYKSFVGYIGNETMNGMSIGFGIERKLNKYLGIEIGIDNWYRYGDGVTEKVMSETNSGLSLSLCLHPLVYKRNALDFYAGYGLNFMHWTNIKGGQGRHLFLGSPILGVGYYRSYNNFKLGFVYKYQHLQRRLEADSNQQFLLSFSKSF